MRSLLVLCLTTAFASLAFADDDAIKEVAPPIATTVQLPTSGVSFDAEGVLQLNTRTDPSG